MDIGGCAQVTVITYSFCSLLEIRCFSLVYSQRVHMLPTTITALWTETWLLQTGEVNTS